MKNRITVFVPTYNRAHLLPILLKSLEIQDYKQFELLVIDDGSTDDTKSLIDEWQAKSNFDIRYVFQENSGKNVAYNIAIDEFTTELFIEIDSDDYFLPNALSTIIEVWNDRPLDKNIGAIQYLCEYEDGRLIGDKFTKTITDNYELRKIDRIGGDKGMVYESSKIKMFRVPVIPGENVIYSILHNRISTICKTLCINTPLVVKDYLDGGITHTNTTKKKNRFGSLMIMNNELNHFNLSLGKYIAYNIKYVKNGFLFGKKATHIYKEAIHKKVVFFIPLLIGFIASIIKRISK